jgi:hypothetical protein
MNRTNLAAVFAAACILLLLFAAQATQKPAPMTPPQSIPPMAHAGPVEKADPAMAARYDDGRRCTGAQLDRRRIGQPATPVITLYRASTGFVWRLIGRLGC